MDAVTATESGVVVHATFIERDAHIEISLLKKWNLGEKAGRKTALEVAMAGGFEEQVKERAKELKHLVKKGMKAVGETCKKTWHKVRHIKG
ncbi:hypothetical protein BHM03_00039920 [Ensete ventricosum]|nr:hypothetical protein BHM03_00039920 [Ensete ventricosum]